MPHPAAPAAWPASSPRPSLTLLAPRQALIYSPEGKCLHAYRPYEHALGVKTLAWSPGGQFLALGSFDERVRLLNHLTWQRIAEVEHLSDMRPSDYAQAVAYVEPATDGLGLGAANENDDENARAGAVAAEAKRPPVGYVATRPPLTVPALKPNFDQVSPKLGVGLLQWSASGRFLMSRNDNMPCAVWVWDAANFALHTVLVQQQPVRAAAWHPRQELLAVCSGSAKLFLWSPQGCRTAPMPAEANFRVQSVEWSPNGDTMLLLDRERFCMCFMGEDGQLTGAPGGE